MKLIFSPIDIDLAGFKFQQSGELERNNLFNPYWNSTFIKEESIQKNNFGKILDQLPFTRITRLFYKTQKKAVGSHIDVMSRMIMEDGEYEHIKLNEPCGYRIVINGGLDKLKVLKHDTWVTAYLPSTPCCYVINSTESYHSVEYDQLRETIYVRGFINQEKHKLLLDKSIKKFENYVIYE